MPQNRLPAGLFASFLRVLLLFACLALAGVSARAEDTWAMGAIGGKFQVQPGSRYLRVSSLTAGAPGGVAGLQAGDFIYGAFGETFGVTHTNSAEGGYKGATQDFGNAIERAESGNGALPLTVLRPGTGGLTITVNLPAAGAFGPAYPLGSTKFNAMYEWAAGQIHSIITAGTGEQGYNGGFFGLILLAHPNWNDTSGAKPYRTTINKLRDASVAYMNTRIVAPVEANQAGFVDSGSLENWTITSQAMFLATYRQKTGDTSVDAACQLAADMLANRIQDYQQPDYNGNPGATKIGLMGHSGVVGDYPHLGYSGINIINAHTMVALAMLKGAGATVNADKFTKSYTWMLSCTSDGTTGEGGNVGYAWKQGGYDSSGRTAGLVFGMHHYGGMDATQAGHVDRMKGYLSRHWQRFQVAHAYTVGGVAFYQFAMPYLADRDQRFLRENFKHFYQFHRNPAGTLEYFGGRGNNGGDGYLNTARVAMINVAIAQAIGSGNLPNFPGLNTARIHADFKSPWLSWPTLAARYATVRGSSANFTVDVTNYLGTVLNPSDYTASWTKLSGPAATFGTPNAASTSVTFSSGGRYRLQLAASRAGYTVTEPIDLDVFTAATPAGYVTGQVDYQIYTGITGSAVSNLTSAPSYPNQPAITSTLSTLEGTHAGDNYGSRIRGWILPPATGAYTFYIASDDSSQFKFGTSEAAATVLCSVSGSTSKYQWTKYASQTSAAQNLTAGTPYFFEVLHKEGGGGDHLAVAWTMPGVTTPEVIDGKFLATQGTGALAFTQQPQSQTAAAGAGATFRVQVTGAGPFIFQWRRNGVSHWPASSSPTLTLANVGAGAAGNYDCVVTAPSGTLTSATATLSVTGVGVLTPGGLWRDYFADVSGVTVASLTGNSRYPNFPDSGGPIVLAEDPENPSSGESFGQRWTGWLKPDVTGAYKFYLASDDASELWLSTTEQPAGKVKLTQVNGYTGARAWSAGGKSALINLTAGNRYYIEVRHKGGGGIDHCALAWQRPGDAVPANGSAPIDGQYLEYLTGGIYDDVVQTTLTLVAPAKNNVSIRPGVGLLLQATASPPAPGAAIAWTQESGPGTVTFTSPSALATGATFSTAGTYLLRCTLDNGGLPATVEVTVNVTTATAAAWTDANIAEPTPPGAGAGTVNANGTITVTGAGQDIYGTSDKCHLFYKAITGDFDVRARVASKSATANFGTHAALMARETTAANSRNVAITHEMSDRVAFQFRTTTAGYTNYQSIPSIALPVWQRLVRSGGNPATGQGGQTFTGYYSLDGGATWIQRSSYTFTTAMPNSLLVGLAVSNAGDVVHNTVVFDNVSGFGIEANFGPVVSAGADASVLLPAAATLNGSATDDGIPAAITRAWSKVSGPGAVTFGDPGAASTTASFTQPGTYVLRLVASDGEVATYDEAAISVAATPWQSWQQMHFGPDAGNPAIAGDHADPDFDGLANVLEYALATDPKAADASSVVVSMATIAPNKFLRLTITKNAAATDVQFTVQVNGNLSNSAGWNSTDTVIEQNTATTLVVRDAIPGPSRFIRLRVTRTP